MSEPPAIAEDTRARGKVYAALADARVVRTMLGRRPLDAPEMQEIAAIAAAALQDDDSAKLAEHQSSILDTITRKLDEAQHEIEQTRVVLHHAGMALTLDEQLPDTVRRALAPDPAFTAPERKPQTSRLDDAQQRIIRDLVAAVGGRDFIDLGGSVEAQAVRRTIMALHDVLLANSRGPVPFVLGQVVHDAALLDRVLPGTGVRQLGGHGVLAERDVVGGWATTGSDEVELTSADLVGRDGARIVDLPEGGDDRG